MTAIARWSRSYRRCWAGGWRAARGPLPQPPPAASPPPESCSIYPRRPPPPGRPRRAFLATRAHCRLCPLRSPAPGCLMERADILELMTRLKLYGMRAAYDAVMTTGIKRRHEPARIVGELLSAEIAEKHARSIKYQMTIAKLPLAKEIDDFDFTGTPINQALIRDLAGGGFIVQQRNAVLVSGTGTGKS